MDSNVDIFLSPAAAKKSTAELSKHRTPQARVVELKNKCEAIERREAERRAVDERKRKEEIDFLKLLGLHHTVDGSEKLGKKTVEVGSRNPIIYKVLAPSKRWLGMGFPNHQQYHLIGLWFMVVIIR